jgi:hypothetical protein
MDLHDIALAAAIAKGNGGTGGTSDYSDLTNKPSINGNQLVGDKTTAQLGITETWVGTQAQYASNPPAVGQPYIITDDQDIDSTPTQNSTNPVTSGGVYSALARLDPQTGDIYFGQTRVARVMDSDSYAALTTKDNIYYLTYPSPTPSPSLSMSSVAKGADNEKPDEKEPETKKNTEMEIRDEQLEKLPPFGFGGYDE